VVEEDARLKCGTPAGANAQLKSALVDQKDEIITLLQADRSTDRSVTPTPARSEQSASPFLQSICREVASPSPGSAERMTQFAMELRADHDSH